MKLDHVPSIPYLRARSEDAWRETKQKREARRTTRQMVGSRGALVVVIQSQTQQQVATRTEAGATARCHRRQRPQGRATALLQHPGPDSQRWDGVRAINGVEHLGAEGRLLLEGARS
jgi:hypothetical protein